MAGSSRPPASVTLLKLFGILLVTGVLGAGVLLPYVGGLGLLAGHESGKFLNTSCNLVETPPPLRTTIYARDGKTEIATIFTQNRIPVPLSQVPKFLQQELIATEDRRFYKHHGVDMRGLIRSAFNTTNGDTQGGSTLTMQYVKQVRLYQARGNKAKQEAAIAQNATRKMEDMKCALDIEKRESKDQILDNYLNIAYFGEGAYGIEVAARTYFGKDVSKLTVPEGAMLVGLLRAPGTYDPFVPDNIKISKDRRNQVIQNMVDVGYLSAADGEKYKSAPLRLATTKPQTPSEGCTGANPNIANIGFFCDYVTRWLENQNGINDLDTGGYKIITTLDPTVQNAVQAGVAKFPAKSPMTAVLPVVDPKTGDILAMGASKEFGFADDGTHTANQIFTDASAAGASTFKLFALLAALQAGVPLDQRIEAPNPYTATTCPNPQDSGSWNNLADHVFPTTDTLSDAIARSSNTYFIALADKLFSSCDLAPYVNMALSLGMTSLQSRAKDIEGSQEAGFMLGSGFNASPLELAGAYATVANDGVYCPPAGVLSITDENGKPIPVKRAACSQKLAPQVAREAVQALTGDTQGVGTTAQVFQPYYSSGGAARVIAGKTGTGTAADNKSNSSLWFVGLTPGYVGAAAIENIGSPYAPAKGLPGISDTDAAISPNVTGAVAAQYWLDAMNPLLANQTWNWPGPNDLTGALSGAVNVPPTVGQPLAQATATLQGAGFKVNALNGGQPYCGSDQPYGAVGYQAPTVAKPGATITVCVSNGNSIYTPPPPPPPPPPTHQSTTPTPGAGSTPRPGGGQPSGRQPGGGGASPGPGGRGGHGPPAR